ncbi:hypothetical protein QOT17_015604 [Balamuthia mandrillaris]
MEFEGTEVNIHQAEEIIGVAQLERRVYVLQCETSCLSEEGAFIVVKKKQAVKHRHQCLGHFARKTVHELPKIVDHMEEIIESGIKGLYEGCMKRKMSCKPLSSALFKDLCHGKLGLVHSNTNLEKHY